MEMGKQSDFVSTDQFPVDGKKNVFCSSQECEYVPGLGYHAATTGEVLPTFLQGVAFLSSEKSVFSK